MLFKFLSDVVEEGTTTPEVPETTKVIDWDALLNTIVEWLTTSGVKLLIGLVGLFILFKLTNALARFIRKRMEKHNVDLTIRRVTVNVVKIVLKALVLVAFLGYVGIDTAGIAGAITSAGVALGLALQGSLSNLAGGIIILLMRPFRIGDYITAQGESGTVEEIHMFYTQLVTPDNKVIMVPNGSLANGVIVNVNMKDKRRVDFVFGISYSSDIEKAKQIIAEVFAANDLILKTPAPSIVVSELADSSVNIASRAWTKTSDYWTVFHAVMETIKNKFDECGIEVPYPQIDIHVDNKN